MTTSLDEMVAKMRMHVLNKTGSEDRADECERAVRVLIETLSLAPAPALARFSYDAMIDPTSEKMMFAAHG